MNNFSYLRATSVAHTLETIAEPGAMLLAGGTTLIDLAKCGVVNPDKVVDITHIAGLDQIEVGEEGAFIGCLAKMSRVADHQGIRAEFPAVSEALWQAASAQLR